MAIAPEEGMTPEDIRAANAAVNRARIAGSAKPKAPTLEPTVTIGGAPAGYQTEPSVNYITGQGVPTGANKATTNLPGSQPQGMTGASTQGVAGIDPSVQEYINAINAARAASDAAAQRALQAERVSAFNILKEQFSQYGLGSLVDGIKNLLVDGTPASEFAIRLRETPEYKARFAANDKRIQAGLSALSPAEYVALEDQYQNIMRNYGLPATYYSKDAMGTQAGFQKLLANDVSASELEDRIATAQQRVLNTNPEVLRALRQFYPDLNNADILAYTLDPQNALANIKRKVTAAEIGGAALGQGLSTSQLDAEGLAGYGITKQQAEAGYGQIADYLPTAQKLASIYQEQPYTQQQAEQEIFNLAGSAEASKKRKKLAAAEQATFSGSSGLSSGALSRDRALNSQSYGSPGAY